MKHLPILIFTAFFISSTSLVARILPVRTLALSGAGELPERFVRGKEGYVKIPFSPVQPSDGVQAQADGTLPLFKQSTDASGKPAFQLAEKVKLPSDTKGILLLSWNSPDGHQYLAIDDDFSSANYDSWLMINAASKPVAFQIGDESKPFLIRANSTKSCKIDTPAGTGAAVLGKAQWGKQVKTFYSTYWPIRDGERAIVIFAERGNRIAVKKISDIFIKSTAVEPD